MRCCERHASRLFREVCGRSFRVYISQLRLKKACQLLLQGNHKIIDVALESGHGSLSVFNYLFKKQFKTTPTEWRDRHLRRTSTTTASKTRVRIVLNSLIFMILFLGAALQAAEPAAPARAIPKGSSQPPAATNAPAALRFPVRQYDVQGNTLVPRSRLEAILTQFTGPAVDLETIRKAQEKLKAEYLDRGYLTVAVTVPPQQVTNGVVRMQVTEGRLAEIEIVHNRYFSSNNIRRALPGLQTNRVLNGKFFQAELDRANANPDRQIYPEVRAGPEPGTSALVLDVKDRLPLHGRAEINNQNTPGSPELRANMNLSYDNLWQNEHSFGLQYGASPELTKGDNLPGLFLTPFDAPAVTYYSGYYRAPLSSIHSLESAAEVDSTRFGFNEATRQFVMPPSLGRADLTFYGTRSTTDLLTEGPRVRVVDTALEQIDNQQVSRTGSQDQTAGGRLGVPLPKLGQLQSSLSMGLDYKDHYSISLPTNVFYVTTIITNEFGKPITKQETTGIPGDPSKQSVSYVPLFFGWSGVVLDHWGQTSGGLSAVFSPGDPLADASDFQKSVSPRADGEFLVGKFQLAREQHIFNKWILAFHSEGQLASQPLVTLEQFGLGGYGSVRGYHEGEIYGDNGWFTQFELKSPTVAQTINVGGRAMRISVGTSVFTDYGQIYLIDPQGRPPETSLWGAGFGGNLAVGSHFEARLNFGWPLLKSPSSTVGSPRVTFAVSAVF
jgi:hemolysin activation/secretion protein